MWRLWPVFKRLWGAAGTVAAGLAIKDLVAFWTNQSVPDLRRLSRFPWDYWYWTAGALTLFAIVSIFAARAHRRHKAPRFIGIAPGRARNEAKLPTLTAPTAAVALMVGRESELSQLRDWFARVLKNERRVVFVTGEAGAGKTTLVRAFLDSLTKDGAVRIWSAQCIEQYGAGEPYMPMLEVLTQLGRGVEGRHLLALMHRLAPAWLAQLPALLTAEERARIHGETHGLTQQRMLREMAETLAALAAELPLVLLLENLHWSDTSTLDLIAAIARRTEPARLLILGTYRPVEMLAGDHPLRGLKQELELHGHCHELRLKLLNEAEVAAYLTQRFAENGSQQQFDSLAPLIYERTEGNPLFMVNVVDYLVAQGSELNASKIETPRNIRQMIERNLDRLETEEQAVLQGASVAGAEFSAAAVAAALERPVSEIEACCTRLSRHEQFVAARGMSEWPDGTVASNVCFLHALYREVLYDRVPPGRRIELHRRIAAREEIAYGERAGEIAAELADHYNRAHDKIKAAKYFQLAGERAAAKGADSGAIAQFGAALELVAKLPDDPASRLQEMRLRILIGPSLMAVKGLGSSETAANYTRALELCRLAVDTSALFEALSGLWTFHLVRAEHREADALAQQLLASAHESKDDSHLAFANFAAGNTAFWRGQLETAAERLARSIAACKPGQRLNQVFVDDPAVYSRAYAAWIQHYRGRPDHALATVRDCMQVARMQSHPRTLAMATQFAGHLHLLRREPDVVVEHCRTLASLASENGFPFYRALAEILAGCAAIQHGEGAQAVQGIKRAIDAWQSLGSGLAVPWFLGELAEGLRSIGRCDEALDVVSDALHRTEKSGERQFAAELHRIAGMLALTQNRFVEAEGSFRRAIDIARTQGARMWELRATRNLASLLKKRGDRETARAMLAEIYNWFTEGFDTLDLKEAKALLETLQA
jgi:predicted ATPase